MSSLPKLTAYENARPVVGHLTAFFFFFLSNRVEVHALHSAMTV